MCMLLLLVLWNHFQDIVTRLSRFLCPDCCTFIHWAKMMCILMWIAHAYQISERKDQWKINEDCSYNTISLQQYAVIDYVWILKSNAQISGRRSVQNRYQCSNTLHWPDCANVVPGNCSCTKWEGHIYTQGSMHTLCNLEQWELHNSMLSWLYTQMKETAPILM